MNVTFIPLLVETWMLFKLLVTFTKQRTHICGSAIETSDFSGIEMESPHKELATAHEFPCNISDVEVRPSWIVILYPSMQRG